MTKAYLVSNSKCMKCGSIKENFIKVGCLSFCKLCYKEEFGENYEFKTGSKEYENYRKWLDKIN